jgi:hypothetical protein
MPAANAFQSENVFGPFRRALPIFSFDTIRETKSLAGL